MKHRSEPSGQPRTAASVRPTCTGDDAMRERVAFLTELIRDRGRRSKGSVRNAGGSFSKKLRSALGMQEADVDDVIQDAVEELLRTKEPITSLAAWFKKTATNRKLRFLRLETQARSFAPRLAAEIELRGSPYPAPDVETERRLAIRRLVKRVHPGRQAVAAQGLAGHSVPQIAAALKLRKNTVKSQWGRAKKDIGGPGVVLALLASVWLWAVARGKRFIGACAGNGGTGARALVASAAVPLLVTGHATVAAPPEPDIAWEEPAPVTEHDVRSHHTFAPMLTTNAEREREREAPSRTSSVVLSEDSQTDGEGQEDRGLLDQAFVALEQGHVGVAEDALRLYDSERPDNPFPSLRARVAAGLAAAKAP